LEIEIPCYVLNNGMKLIGRVSATEVSSGIKGGGGLERYIKVKAPEPFINKDLILERMVRDFARRSVFRTGLQVFPANLGAALFGTGLF
jgi:hypothetical protein